MSTVLLSVVMPVFNREKFLSKSISSVKYLSNLSYELIIVDDGSVDNSILVAEEEIVKNDIKNYKIIRSTENQGVSNARNKGINNSVGEYILFLDSDDELLPEAGELILQGIDSNYDVVCYGYLVNGVKSPLPKSENLFLDFLENKFSNTNTIMCKRKTLNTLRFREGFPIGEDTDFWARLLFSNFSKIYINGYLAMYNFSPRAKYAEKHPFFDITLWELDIDEKIKKHIYDKYMHHKLYLQAANRKILFKDLLKKKSIVLIFLYIFGQKGFLFLWNVRNAKRRVLG